MRTPEVSPCVSPWPQKQQPQGSLQFPMLWSREPQVAPPLGRDEAAVSGAVRWSRTLFVRLKRTWGRLQQQEGAALQDSVGSRVRIYMTSPAITVCIQWEEVSSRDEQVCSL
jgi:hypothetical protein